jgi:hypothetical protein
MADLVALGLPRDRERARRDSARVRIRRGLVLDVEREAVVDRVVLGPGGVRRLTLEEALKPVHEPRVDRSVRPEPRSTLIWNLSPLLADGM